MKGFKKLALVAAIAAPISSVHALEALDDSMLSDMTGQSGVSIELDTKVTIDKFTYTDEGSIMLDNIAFGGAGLVDGTSGDRFDDVLIDIDVDAAGNLVIHLGSTNLPGVLTGSAPVDFGLTVGGFGLAAAGSTATETTIASNIALAGTLGPQDIVILNDGSNTIKAQGYFEVTGGGMNVDIAGIGISNLTIGQDGNPFASATDAQGNAKLVDYSSKVVDPSGTTADALGSGDDNWAFYGVTIGTTAGSDVTNPVSDALSLTVDSFNVDIAMDVTMGKNAAGTALSIGSIAMDNLDVSGTKLVIYGH